MCPKWIITSGPGRLLEHTARVPVLESVPRIPAPSVGNSARRLLQRSKAYRRSSPESVFAASVRRSVPDSVCAPSTSILSTTPVHAATILSTCPASVCATSSAAVLCSGVVPAGDKHNEVLNMLFNQLCFNVPPKGIKMTSLFLVLFFF
jgi:hypothetical protein